MTESRRPEARRSLESRRSESGFALILALLALMLLTFLGLTLATSTSTELRIATNYRWQQQALFNAEAGIEAGKTLLRGMNWTLIVPGARTTTWDGNTTPATQCGGACTAPQSRNDQWGNGSRNFEGWPCDQRGNGMGYGVVLDDGGTGAPYQYKTTVFGQSVNGAFTLWVRRPPYILKSGQVRDWGSTIPATETSTFGAASGVDDSHLILVSEGIAPYTGAQLQSTRAAGNAAVQVIEVLVSRATALNSPPCGTRGGQAGQGQEGAGFSGCDNLDAAGVGAAFGAGVNPGSGADTGVR